MLLISVLIYIYLNSVTYKVITLTMAFGGLHSWVVDRHHWSSQTRQKFTVLVPCSLNALLDLFLHCTLELSWGRVCTHLQLCFYHFPYLRGASARIIITVICLTRVLSSVPTCAVFSSCALYAYILINYFGACLCTCL